MWLSILPRPDVPPYCLHQVLWSYFPDVPPGSDRPFLFREAGRDIILLGRRRPASPTLDIRDRVRAGRAYQFDVLASPVKTVRPAGKGSPRTLRCLTGNDERRAWFARRLNGAEPGFTQVFDVPTRRFKKANGEPVTLYSCRIKGVLHVTNRALFIDTLLTGIGGRGCWGCGLLILPEIMREALP